ncbi:MAG: hypothetical protein R3C31_14595 [Hyphomonadaceae bacterium]
MLLRRVMEQVRAQNWFAVGVDLVIVVLGVFLGIQMGNWNESRLEKAQSVTFTRLLEHDLHADAARYRDVAAYYTSVRDNAVRALGALEREAPLSDEALIIAAYRASQVALVPINRSTFDELVSTGRINLITNPGLRAMAIEHFGFNYIASAAADGRQSSYRNLLRETLPPEAHRAAREHCGDVDSAEIVALDYPCSLGLSAATIHHSANALRAERAIPASLRHRSNELDIQIRDLITRAAQLDRASSAEER